MIKKDVLIEINDKSMSFKDGLYADIDFSEDIIKKYKIKGDYFPCIGFSITKSEVNLDENKILTGKIFSLGICVSKNQDERIKSIEL